MLFIAQPAPAADTGPGNVDASTQNRIAGRGARCRARPRLRPAALLLVPALLLLHLSLGLAQRPPNWRAYKLADGLPESACIAVTVSSQGKLLVRHLNLPLVTELDGYNILSRPAPELGKSRIYQSPGGQLWTVVPQGLQEFKNGEWILHPVPQLAAAYPGASRIIDPLPLWPVRQDVILVLLPAGLLELNCEKNEARTRVLRAASQTALGSFSGMTLARDGGLWVAGERGLAKLPGPVRYLQPDTPWREFPIPESLGVTNLNVPHENPFGGVRALGDCGTNRDRRIVAFDGEQWSLAGPANERLRHAWVGPGQTEWAMTFETLLQKSEPAAEWHEVEDISARQYMDMAVEPGGAFWLATSDGLFRYAPMLWQTPGPLRSFTSPIASLGGDQEGRLWFFSGNRVHSYQTGGVRQYTLPSPDSAHLQARALFQLKNGTVLLAAQSSDHPGSDQLFRFQAGRGMFLALNPDLQLGPVHALGLLPDGNLCLADLAPSAGPACPLLRFDGRRLEALPEAPSKAALGTNVVSLFATQEGDLWLSGDLGTAWFHEKKWKVFPAADRSAPAFALSFLEMPDGRIWAAAEDEVWEFDGQNWSVLRRGFDHINDIERTRDGSVWVASNNGLHRFFQGTWVENGPEEGLPAQSVREVFEDARGQLWAATTRGLSVFHPEADPDPPHTTIQEIAENGGNIPAGGTVSLIFNGRDKWKYTSPDRLLYSYRLDEHDWSAFQELNHVSFSDLPAGKHVLQVRAMDRNCNIENRAVHEFAFILPWYKESRLVLIGSAGLAAALFFAALAFNRHRRLVHSYAEIEQKVAERTHQLELASRELLHSQKMTALGTLAAGIAHDFNNILSIIKGSAQIIEDNLDNPEKIRTRADRIRTVVEQGAGIVKAMLGFSRGSGDLTAPCDINSVVQDTLKLLGDRFLREVHVSFEPQPGLPEVLASKDFVQQILLNFIFNAAESMTRDRRVILAAQPLKAVPLDVVLAPAPAAGYVAVSVQDFGCGITPQTMPRIFEPFFTTKALSTRRGTGLGLSMVYELAKKLGAGLAVESTVDLGSTFILILPVHEPKTGNPT